MAEIRVEHLHKAFADFVAVKDSSFTVKDGEFFCLLGPSGCGKTTTLRMIAGLELPTAGPDLPRRRGRHLEARLAARHRLRVPAVRALSAHERAQEHRLPAGLAGHAARARSTRKVEEAARILQITRLLDRPVSGLSSGDRQRVALGRAIVRQPLAFMMDEPLGALDSEFRELMCAELRAPARPPEGDHGLRHPRPDGSDGDGRHHRHHEQRRDRAARRAAGGVRPAGLGVRRRLHRRAGDELHSLRRRLRRRQRRGADRRRARRRARAAPRPPPAASCSAACAPSTCASTTPRACAPRCVGSEYLGHSQIVTVTTAVGSTLRAKVGAAGAGRARRARRPGVRRAHGLAVRQAHAAAPWPCGARRAPWLSFASIASAKSFGATTAVRELSLDIASGEFIVLLGPSGAGKTTTLRLVAGLETPDQGSVFIGGHDVTRTAPALRDVTFVFQQYSLYPHLSVYDNLAFPLRSPLRRMPEARVHEKVLEIARLLRIDDKLANPATRALRRADAARGDRPRAGARARGDADGRAAVLARRQAAQRPAPRAEADPAGPRRDHALRHPRPDRGADPGDAHRRARPRPRWRRWAARARSTRTRRPAPSPRASARRASTSCRAPRSAPGPRPTGAATLGVRAEHLHLRTRRRPPPDPRCARRCGGSSS